MIEHNNNIIEIEEKDLKEPSPEEIARNFFFNRDIEMVEDKIGSLKQFLLSMVHTNNRLQSQFNKLWDKKWKDNELQNMKKQLEEMRADYHRGFPISKSEEKKINEWILKHDEEEHNNFKHYHGCSGGGYIYEFCPTGLGTIGYCFCSSCHDKAIKKEPNNWYDYCKNELHGVFEFGDFG